jgi:uncharacterized protein YecT (DUF1311 family)
MWNRVTRRPLVQVAGLVLCGAGLAGMLAGCNSPGSTGSSGGAGGTGGGTSSPTATQTATTAAAAPFVSIVEPWDPGHPARVEPAPASCGQGSTLTIEKCYETMTENLDAEINATQAAKYASADAAGRASILSQDSAWLAARGPVCQAAFHSGGTIDGINVAACLFGESNARYIAVKGITPHEYELKATDNSEDPSALSWYTTPEGSRIAELSTQGDQTGGAVVSWIIIGGAQGFVVNPKQFFYLDSQFRDPGVIQGANPTYHVVPTGQEFQFSIDYSNLSKDPNGGKGGYVYAPGDPVAEWN